MYALPESSVEPYIRTTLDGPAKLQLDQLYLTHWGPS